MTYACCVRGKSMTSSGMLLKDWKRQLDNVEVGTSGDDALCCKRTACTYATCTGAVSQAFLHAVQHALPVHHNLNMNLKLHSNLIVQALGPMEAEAAAEWGATLDAYRMRLQDERMPAAERRALQDSANPAYIPRNALMQGAIAAAEVGDFDEVRQPVPPQVALDSRLLRQEAVRPGLGRGVVLPDVNLLAFEGPCMWILGKSMSMLCCWLTALSLEHPALKTSLHVRPASGLTLTVSRRAIAASSWLARI